MAFVPALGLPLRTSAFTPCANPLTRPTVCNVASFRMAADTEDPPKESPVFGKAGDSMWKESLFTGGFPGGEAFYKAWAEDGMTKDVPDMPESMQSKNDFKPKTVTKGGVLGKLDATEFFKSFADQVKEEEEESGEEEVQPVTGVKIEDDPVPDESLYKMYYPASIRYKAPEIDIVYGGAYDKVGVAMTGVTATASEVYFPRESQGKAPVIEIFYNGTMASAYVKMSMQDIDGLPTLPPPPKEGDAVTKLVPGRGGGLKLEFSVEGTGDINI
eukprot:GFKZ01014507.1.p2 GENE.GFKZ01014507.1~~GFKZ01014507.1.p2  ORF type:complete len:272 (-),score=47.82 GFKZ01014507.1:1632-2447(-)